MIIINLLLFFIGVALYILNKILLAGDYYGIFYWLMHGYFNDFVGSISFISYCNLASIFFRHRMYFTELHKILVFLLGCGVFWEFITPLYRENTISDPWDLVAYLSGGLLYYIIIKLKKDDKRYLPLWTYFPETGTFSSPYHKLFVVNCSLIVHLNP